MLMMTRQLIMPFDTILKENGTIDVLVNNAGFDMFGSLEELTIDEIRGQFETNFFGVVRSTKAVIPTVGLLLQSNKSLSISTNHIYQ